MLKSLELRNFQGHRRLFLELDPGVNAIVGPTDSGKSAVVRALFWVAFNQPTGDAFRSHWGGRTIVTIETDAGVVVKRVKTDTDNYYQVGDSVYRGFGRGVPEEVTRALQLSPINFSRQMDPPFLLSLSPQQAAKELNKIANLDSVDKALAWVAGETRSGQANCRAISGEISRSQQELESLAGLDSAVERFEEVSGLGGELAGVYRKFTDLGAALGRYKRADQDLTESQWTVSPFAEEALAVLPALIDEEQKLRQRCRLIGNVLGQISAGREAIVRLEQEYDDLKAKFSQQINSAPCPLCGRSGPSEE